MLFSIDNISPETQMRILNKATKNKLAISIKEACRLLEEKEVKIGFKKGQTRALKILNKG